MATATQPQPVQKEFRPQEGPQEMFLSTPADIAIYGGMAGGGKTWSLLFEPLRHILPSDRWPSGVLNFTGVIFRRTRPQIRNEGGLWDESYEMYNELGGNARESILEWRFEHKQTMRFASMQYEANKLDWQGAQIPFIGFDELTHFTESQFFYMLSRNRSTCGIKPYIRATCNPDADSWVADFIAWWIDQREDSPTYGLPRPDRIGKIRYMLRVGDKIHWASQKEELRKLIPEPMLRATAVAGLDPLDLIKSVTFIPASVYDNKILLANNPEYLGNLLSLPLVERERLLGGNWKIRASAGFVFNSDWWAGKIVHATPAEGVRIRYWDKAATETKKKSEEKIVPWTVGVLVLRTKDGRYFVEDVQRFQATSLKRDRLMLQCALRDPEGTTIWIEQEPGSGGKESAESSIRKLAGFKVKVERVTGDKVSRALPASSQVEAGNVYMLKALWNRPFIDELHAFPDARLKDQADAFSGAMAKLMRRRKRQGKNFPTITE